MEVTILKYTWTVTAFDLIEIVYQVINPIKIWSLTFKNTHVNYKCLKNECLGRNFDLRMMMKASNLGYEKLYY